VKGVRVSTRLTDSAVCLAADDQDLDMHLARLLQEQGGIDARPPRILEVNPQHALVRSLATGVVDGDDFEDIAHLLLDQARLLEGEEIPDAAGFAQRMAATIERSLA
jgi:molecular chaperone HtpG